jgi:hypothetical protein
MKKYLLSLMSLHILCLPLIAFVAVLCAGPLASAQGQWTELFPTKAPQKRCEHQMVRFGTSEILLYGGENNSLGQIYGDIWSWDGADWTLLQSATFPPSPRTGHMMSYDPVRGLAVMFSGWDGGNYLSDTVEWNGKAWKYTQPTNSPPGRDWGQMVFDHNSGTSIVFGGHDWTMGSFGDTWSWDGTDWTQLFPVNSPSPRAAHSMVFDKNLGKVILIGGWGFGPPNEMWAWDGTNWAQLSPATMPTMTGCASLAYDDARNRAVLYGGTAGAGMVSNEVWEWDGIDWTLTDTTGPAYAWLDAEYDPIRQEILVQGGSITSDRSAVDGSTWSYAGPSMLELLSDVTEISEATGGTATFTLDAGGANANSGYAILGSVTGTSPGTMLPSGEVLPLNWDVFTNLVVGLMNMGPFQNFLGSLNGSGQGTAAFIMPSGTGVAGVTFYFAYALYPPWGAASNAVEIKVVQ